MARSHVAGCLRRPEPASPVPQRSLAGQLGSVNGRLARAARVTAVAVAVAAGLASAALPLAAGQALAASTQPPASLGMSVTSVSPPYGTPGRPIVLTGLMHNASSSAIANLSLQLSTSASPFTTMSALQEYASSGITASGLRLVKSASLGKLGADGTRAWQVRLPASLLGLSCFGVYPLTAQITDSAGTVLAAVPVPLPYWPKRASGCPSAQTPAPFPISWIWPLIDTPHQGPCPGLVDASLASRIEPHGRLGELLAAGSSPAAKGANLTWAIDPALLDNVQTITHGYLVGSESRLNAKKGLAGCSGGTLHAASPYAAQWLTALAQATAGRAVFVTPYADADVAPLTQYGGDVDLRAAFDQGQSIAGQILHRSPVPARLPASTHSLSSVAWPFGGIADGTVLDGLAAMGISTVVLTMSPYQAYTPGAVASYLTGITQPLHILLADDTIGALLASPQAMSRHSGTIFGVAQLYLAETAMIAAEAPAIQRPIVVTPPRSWNPAAMLARDLLADTTAAPWLKPSTINQLVSLHASQLSAMAAQAGPPAALSAKLLRQVTALDSKVALLKSIMVKPYPELSHAIFGIESSAWRTAGARQARAMLARTVRFVNDQFDGLSISADRNVTLGGKNSSGLSVSIHSSLDYPVTVALRVTPSQGVTTGPTLPVTIRPHNYSPPIKLTVHTTQTGPATLRLTVTTPPRRGAPAIRLPVAAVTMQITATNFGTVLLAICAVALAIFVAASAAQALRHGRPGPRTPPEPAPPSGPAEPAEQVQTGAGSRQAPSSQGDDEPEQSDSVIGNRSELAPAGPAKSDLAPPAPGRRSAEEDR